MPLTFLLLLVAFDVTSDIPVAGGLPGREVELSVRSDPNLPQLLICEQCGETAIVKAYLPIYQDGPVASEASAEPILKAMTCVIDCAKCGVREQVLKVPSAD